jgi:hypothetical protein
LPQFLPHDRVILTEGNRSGHGRKTRGSDGIHRPPVREFLLVEAAGIEQERDLVRWVETGADFAESLPLSKHPDYSRIDAWISRLN